MRSNATITNGVHRTVIANKAIAQMLVDNSILTIVEDTLRPYNNIKVTKVDGWWLKALEPVIESLRFEGLEPKLTEGVKACSRHRFQVSKEYGSVYLNVEYWFTFGEYEHSSDGAYYKMSFALGRVDETNHLQLDEGWLKGNYEKLFRDLNTDYSRIEKQIETIKELKAEIAKINNVLPSYAMVR